MQSRKHVAAVLLAVSLVSCAAGGRNGDATPPDWVSGESAHYDAAHYLVGRGAAAELDDAKDRARADLAKTFEVAVSQESRDVQSVQQQSGPDGVRRAGEFTVTRAVQTRSDALLRGVEIAATWRDPASHRHYALAVLPRAQAARALRQDIEALDQATRGHIAAAREQQDVLSQLAAAHKAVATQRERAGLQRMLRVLDLSGAGMPPPWSFAALESDLAALLARIGVMPQAAGSEAAAMEAALRAALADAGVRTVAGTADYVLEAKLELAPLGRRDGWYWYVGRLDLTLRDASGRVRGARHWPIKEAATVEEVAYRRAVERAGATLTAELGASMLDFAGGE